MMDDSIGTFGRTIVSTGSRPRRCVSAFQAAVWRSARGRRTALSAAVLLAMACGNASAADRFWANAAGGNWNTPGNWDTGVPGPGDNAFITLSGTYTVTLDVSPSINSLTLGASTGTQTLSAGGSRTLTLAAASTVG